MERLHGAHGSAVFRAVPAVADGAGAIYRGPSDLSAVGDGPWSGGLFSDGQPADFKAVAAGAGPSWAYGPENSGMAEKNCDFFAKTCKKALFNFVEMGYNKCDTIFTGEKEHTEKGCRIIQ